MLMKKLLFPILVIFYCMISCSKKIIQYGSPGENAGTQYIKSEILKLNRKQFNKKCIQDSIPYDLSYWYKSAFTDFETGKENITYVYIKPSDFNKGTLMNTYKTLLDISAKKDTTFILEIRRLYNN